MSDSRRRQTFSRPVTGTDVLLGFVAVVVAPASAAILVVVTGAKLDQGWLFGLVVPLATGAACAGLWLAFVRRGWSLRDLGYVRARRSLWHVWWEAPLLWVAALTLTALIGTLAGIQPTGRDASSEISGDVLEFGVVAALFTALCATLIVPAVEEVLFRRLVFGWFEQRLGVMAAVAGSAFVFGLVHIAPPVILLQFLIGLGAAVLVRAHGTLWAPLALHGLNNGIVSVAALAVLL